MTKKQTYKEFTLPKLPRANLQSLPVELRGPSNNKYGGHRNQRMRSLKGSKLGAASSVRRPTTAEWAEIENNLRARNLID